MSTYRRLCLLLCSLFMCCVGFLSVSSRAYAYTAEDGFYPIDANYDLFVIALNDNYVFDLSFDSLYNRYHCSNDVLYDVTRMAFSSVGVNDYAFTFPVQPDLYDYYLLGNMLGLCSDNNLSTFKPSSIEIAYFDYSNNQQAYYNTEELYIYDIDTREYKGFGFSEKINFLIADSYSIQAIAFGNDVDGSGNKPANLYMEFGILAVDKHASELEINQRILNKLSEMQESITDSIGSAADQVADAIENQYGMTSGESFGVQDLTSQVEEKLGVLSFGADTLNNFLGLFQASNAGSTVLTFPGFTIDVQGESYQVWNDMQFDLAFLEENFGVLIIAVRTVTVLCVWLAVLGYLVKAYEHLVNNKG